MGCINIVHSLTIAHCLVELERVHLNVTCKMVGPFFQISKLTASIRLKRGEYYLLQAPHYTSKESVKIQT